MTSATYAYGLIVLPPRDLYKSLMTLRSNHPLLRTPIPPHITVKSPFLFRQSAALAIEQLEAVLQRWEPFEVALKGLGLFQNSILYVKVEDSPELVALHQEIVSNLEGFVETLSDRYEGNEFTPHMTIVDRLAPEEIMEVRRILVGLRLTRRFVVDRVHLLRGKGKWDITHSFPLGIL